MSVWARLPESFHRWAARLSVTVAERILARHYQTGV